MLTYKEHVEDTGRHHHSTASPILQTTASITLPLFRIFPITMKTSSVVTVAAAMLLQSSQVQASPIVPRLFVDLAGILKSFLQFGDSFFPDAPTLWYVLF
jgi:hypothetical protein